MKSPEITSGIGEGRMPKFQVTISFEPYTCEVEAVSKEEAKTQAEQLFFAFLEGISQSDCIEIEEIPA
jgi:hypothetical protein